jgi:DNA-binding transcriptional LysR family regulator
MHAMTPLQQRIAEVWNWLPAFRAVAETQHVHLAAQRLHVTPSSLSRSIRLIEDRLGQALFVRSGRRIALNRDGEDLLAAVRDGMRRIDDGLSRVAKAAFDGMLRVVSEGDQPIVMLARASTRMMKQYPGMVVNIARAPSRAETASAIVRGDLDLAIATRAPVDPRVGVEELGPVTYGIYCGASHPLFSSGRLSMNDIRAHGFAAPTSPEADDQWPRHLQRRVVLQLPSLQAAIEACLSGDVLAVLPDVSVVTERERGLLRRLPSKAISSGFLFAIRRNRLDSFDRATAFVAALRAELAEKPARLAPPEIRKRPIQPKSQGDRPRRAGR